MWKRCPLDHQCLVEFFKGQPGEDRAGVTQGEGCSRDAQADGVIQFHFINKTIQYRGSQGIARAGWIQDGGLDGGHMTAGLGGGIDYTEFRQGDQRDIHALVEQRAGILQGSLRVGGLESLTGECDRLRDVGRDQV